MAEPPLRDPTVLCLGRRLRPEEVAGVRCDWATVRAQLDLASPDLAWAAERNRSYYVMRLKEVTRGGLVVLLYDRFDRGEAYGIHVHISNIGGMAWPMIGYTVDRGHGWLKTMMDEGYQLKMRHPLIHFCGYVGEVSWELALGSPRLDLARPFDGMPLSQLYVVPEGRDVPVEDSYKPGCPVPGHFRAVEPEKGIRIMLSNGVRQHFETTDRLRMVRAIPESVVNVVNMRRMAVMYYAVRMNAPLERGGDGMIKRWNPFRLIGVELCARIARLLDCCDASGALLPEYY